MKTIEELQEIKAEIQLHESELHCLKAEMKEACWHPEQFVLDKKEYIEGGYDYKASTIYWSECQICGEKFNNCSKTHSWYG